MPKTLLVYTLGTKGVNVDASPLQLQPDELTQAQNAIGDPLGASQGLRNRPGLTKFNSVAAAGAVYGAAGVPQLNLNTGSRWWFLGRGPFSV